MIGATGYVGGRLVPNLLQRGHRVRCIVREPRKLEARSWRSDPRVEIIRSDLVHAEPLASHMRECSAAYYLILPVIDSGRTHAESDHQLASNFEAAAAHARIERIIYLGKLGDGLSTHLRSRRELEYALRSTAIPVTTLRAAMIIGSGSASFEILRYLVERLPVMITPRWVQTECQPVAIDDVLYWLVECSREAGTIGRSLEIGGPDVLSYRQLMQTMARELGLPRRLIFGIPLLTPRLSSTWISGLLGILYWYAVVPLHHLVFGGMLNGIKRAAESSHSGEVEQNDTPTAGRARGQNDLRYER